MSARQFPQVSSNYGAPMGRHTVGDLDTSRHSVRLFAVRLDSGGYDDGGAYWGLNKPGERLWCATDKDGDMQFVRAATRHAAAFALMIPAASLRVPLRDLSDYVFAMYDGRCPFPAGKDRADLDWWLTQSRVVAREQ